MLRENQVKDKTAGVEKGENSHSWGMCGVPGYLFNHNSLPGKLILSSFTDEQTLAQIR